MSEWSQHLFGRRIISNLTLDFTKIFLGQRAESNGTTGLCSPSSGLNFQNYNGIILILIILL